jgi:hypothetical protein
MDKVFHRDITGRPYVIASEIREWLIETDGQRVQKPFPKKKSKDIVPGEDE